MNRIAALGIALLLGAPLPALPAPAGEHGGGIALGSCGAGSNLIWVGGLANAERADTPDKLARVAASLPEGQWIRRGDIPVADAGPWVLLLAGLLGMWAMARRRNLSS